MLLQELSGRLKRNIRCGSQREPIYTGRDSAERDGLHSILDCELERCLIAACELLLTSFGGAFTVDGADGVEHVTRREVET